MSIGLRPNLRPSLRPENSLPSAPAADAFLLTYSADCLDWSCPECGTMHTSRRVTNLSRLHCRQCGGGFIPDLWVRLSEPDPDPDPDSYDINHCGVEPPAVRSN